MDRIHILLIYRTKIKKL